MISIQRTKFIYDCNILIFWCLVTAKEDLNYVQCSKNDNKL